jgi:hypothetical protein
MKKVLLIPFLAVCLLVGCAEPVPHYNRVSAASMVGAPVKIPPKQYGKIKPYGSVKLFMDEKEVTQKYDVIAKMSVSGSAGDEAKFITAFQYRAADLGADAIIFHRGAVTSGVNFNGFVWSSGQDASFTADAIQFK